MGAEKGVFVKSASGLFLVSYIFVSCSPVKPAGRENKSSDRQAVRTQDALSDSVVPPADDPVTPTTEPEVAETPTEPDPITDSEPVSDPVTVGDSLPDPQVSDPVSDTSDTPETADTSEPTSIPPISCAANEKLEGDKCIVIDPCVESPTLPACLGKLEVPVNRYCSRNLLPLTSISYRVVKDTNDQILTVIELEKSGLGFRLKSFLLSKEFERIRKTNNLKANLTHLEKVRFKNDGYYLLLLTDGRISNEKINKLLNGTIKVKNNTLSDKVSRDGKDIQLFFSRKFDSFWTKNNGILGTGFVSGYKLLGETKPTNFRDFHDLGLKARWNSQFLVHLSTTQHSIEALMVAYERNLFYKDGYCLGDFTNPRPFILGTVVAVGIGVGIGVWIKTSFFSPLVLKFQKPGFAFSKEPSLFDLSADGKLDQFFSIHYNAKNYVQERSVQAHLAVDLNGNGKIDSGLELFGDYTKTRNGERAANGFEALREYDLNQDGKITKADTFLKIAGRDPKQLVLWFDRNNNMETDSGELQPLFHFVRSIHVDYVAKNEVDRLSGNEIRYQSEFEINPDLNLNRLPAMNKIVDVYYRVRE